VQWIALVAECPQQVLCQPPAQMGPVVSVRTSDDPRLYPPLPRNSATFKALMATRTGCERSNAATTMPILTVVGYLSLPSKPCKDRCRSQKVLSHAFSLQPRVFRLFKHLV
jgi:hypothetical protein